MLRCYEICVILMYTIPDEKKTSSFSLTLTMPIASWYTGRTTCILAQLPTVKSPKQRPKDDAPRPLPNVRAATISWVAVVSTTLENASMWIVCLSTLESVSLSLSTLSIAISALALCQNMLENISHLNRGHQRMEIHCFESWIPSPWNVKHATRSILNTLSRGNDLQNVDERKLRTVQGI